MILLGTELRSPETPVLISPKGLLHHSLVVGQSGSGKSFLVARLIEEILLRTGGRVVIADPNGDFRSLHRTNKTIFRSSDFSRRFESLAALCKAHNLGSYEDLPSFESAWSGCRFLELTAGRPAETEDQPNVVSQKLSVHWDQLESEEQDFLLGVDPIATPKLAAGVEACRKNAKWVRDYRPELPFGNDLRGLADIAAQFSAMSIGLKEYPDVKTLTTDDWLAVSATFKDLLHRFHIWWSRSQPHSSQPQKRPLGLYDYLRGGFEGDEESETYWQSLTLSLDSARPGDSLLTVNLALADLWKLAKQGWRDRITSDDRIDRRVPTFIVIDEAHNFAPERPSNSLSERTTNRLVQIASEGRKYGLYLILATQRPTKLHRSLVPECENSCVLRLQSKIELDFAQSVLGIPEDETSNIPKFNRGHGLISGRWVDSPVPTTTYGAPARTEVGGGGLSEHWLSPPEPKPAPKPIEDRVRPVVVQILQASEYPVTSAALSKGLLERFDELEPGAWGVTGRFFDFLNSLEIKGMMTDTVPPGYVWLDYAHNPPPSDTESTRGWEASAEASKVLTALRKQTDLPRLSREQFRTAFELLSAELEDEAFDLAAVTKAIRDGSEAVGRPIGRQAANVIVKSINLSGHDFSSDLAQDPETLAEAYTKWQAHAMNDMSIAIPESVRNEVASLISGGYVPTMPPLE